MSDRELRDLERAARAGDESATVELRVAEARAGLDLERFSDAVYRLNLEVHALATALTPLPSSGWTLRSVERPRTLVFVVADLVEPDGSAFVTVGDPRPLVPVVDLLEHRRNEAGRVVSIELLGSGPLTRAVERWAREAAPDRVRELRDVVERWCSTFARVARAAT